MLDARVSTHLSGSRSVERESTCVSRCLTGEGSADRGVGHWRSGTSDDGDGRDVGGGRRDRTTRRRIQSTGSMAMGARRFWRASDMRKRGLSGLGRAGQGWAGLRWAGLALCLSVCAEQPPPATHEKVELELEASALCPRCCDPLGSAGLRVFRAGRALELTRGVKACPLVEPCSNGPRLTSA